MAIRAMQFLVRREQIAEELSEPSPEALPIPKENNSAATFVIRQAQNEGRKQLSAKEALYIFKLYGIETVPTLVAETSCEAAKAAKKIGYPVVVKLHSETEKGSHKTDLNGVKLGLANDEEVRKAFCEIKKSVTEKIGAEHFQGVTVQPMADMKSGYEILLGIKTDSIFGAAIACGLGGTDAEFFKDKVVTLPGLTESLALRLIKKTKISKKLISGWRGKSGANISAVAKAFVAISRLAEDFPEIDELDINPLIASEKGVLVVDGRITLHEPGKERGSALKSF
jgi:acetyltransferase